MDSADRLEPTFVRRERPVPVWKVRVDGRLIEVTQILRSPNTNRTETVVRITDVGDYFSIQASEVDEFVSVVRAAAEWRDES